MKSARFSKDHLQGIVTLCFKPIHQFQSSDHSLRLRRRQKLT